MSAAILAGGRARRFGGADKSALIVEGERIIDRQLRALASVSDDIRIVSQSPERYVDLAVRVVPDVVPGLGPIGGLQAALLDARHEAVLVLACDMPFVEAQAVQALAAAWRPELDAVVARSARGREPLCAVYARRAGAVVGARIREGQLKLEELLESLRVQELATGAFEQGDRLFENINTPHDYARAKIVSRNNL